MAKQFRDVSSHRGTPMGRQSFGTPPTSKTVSLFKVKLSEGYDDGGAYWGYPNNLWCARDKDEIYFATVRAPSRVLAASELELSNEQLLRGN